MSRALRRPPYRQSDAVHLGGTTVAGLVIVGLVVVLAVAAPVVAPADPSRVDIGLRFAGTSLRHLLGADELGRDELSRLVYGARLSLLMMAGAALITTVVGVVLGVMAGVLGGVVDLVVMRVVDGLQAIPGLILALAVVGIFGPGISHLIWAISAVSWTGYARLVRGMALSIREREFVESARALGASRRRLMARHVLPHLLGPTVVQTTVDMGRILLAVSGLSFLGLGVRPPTPELGAMLAGAKDYLDQDPVLLVYPGIVITVLALAFNLIGEGLRDRLDPRLRRHMEMDVLVAEGAGTAGAATTVPPGWDRDREPGAAGVSARAPDGPGLRRD